MGKLQFKVNPNAFKNAKKMQEEFGGDLLLDVGDYTGEVVGFRNPKANMICMDVKEVESGSKFTIVYSLEENRMVFLLNDLKRMGADCDSPDQVLEAVQAIDEAKPTIRFKVVEKNDYKNANILGLDEEGGGSGGETAVDAKAGKPSAGAKAGSPKADAGKKKPAKVEAEEEEETEAEEEPEVEEEQEEEPESKEEIVEIAPGLKCKVKMIDGSVEKGEVTEIFEDEGKVGVKMLSGAKKGKVLKKLPEDLEA